MSTELKHLITPEAIWARTEMDMNTSRHKLEVSIPIAERRYLRPVLGAALFTELLNFVQQETPDTEDPLAALASQVQDMLCQWTTVEAWPHLLVHITNSGVVTKTGRSEGTSSADARLVESTLGIHRKTAEWHTDELLAWLVARAADYPSFVPPGGPAPSSSMPLGGLHFA